MKRRKHEPPLKCKIANVLYGGSPSRITFGCGLGLSSGHFSKKCDNCTHRTQRIGDYL